MNAMQAMQLYATFPNRIGLLAEVTAALKDANVNILAICAYEFEGRGEFMMVTDNNGSAMEVLRDMGAEVSEAAVIGVELPNRVGALHEVAKRVAEAEVDIDLLYAANYSGDTVAVIMSTADDPRVLELLRA